MSFPRKIALFIFLSVAVSLWAQMPGDPTDSADQGITTSGDFSIIPFDSWAAGDSNYISYKLFGGTPVQKQLSLAMDTTATTSYEGDLWLKKLGLKMGASVDLDNNFIGKLYRLMGYVGYKGFTLRIQTSELSGTATWAGASVSGMPTQSAFDNKFTSIDLIHYYGRQGDYWGIGYTSYQLPVELESTIMLTPNGSIENGTDVYENNMQFQIYSFLYGFDTLHSNTQGLSIWVETQDRFGAGLGYISDEARTWVEEANGGRNIINQNIFDMLVDYDLSLGLQWSKSLRLGRVGIALGYNVGGELMAAVTSTVSNTTQVATAPDFFLMHFGPVLKGSIAW